MRGLCEKGKEAHATMAKLSEVAEQLTSLRKKYDSTHESYEAALADKEQLAGDEKDEVMRSLAAWPRIWSRKTWR